MTQKDKELLLKDLCARLPYGVKIELMPITKGKCTILTPIILQDYFVSDDINYLPYLRPMSSMTEEEEKIFSAFLTFQSEYVSDADLGNKIDMFDWLNANHFDYRGLIEMGLAIEVTEENNPYK